MRSDKQATLSSTLLAGKKSVTPPDAGVADAAPGRSLRIVPPAPPAPGDGRESAPMSDDGERPETLLFSKGAASAAGFKPAYWTYDRGAGEAVAEAAETAAPAAAPYPSAPASAAPTPAPRRWLHHPAQWGVLAFGCIALLLSSHVLFRAPPPADEAPPAAVAPALPGAAAPSPAARVPTPAPQNPPAAASVPAPATAPTKAGDDAARPADLASLVARGSALLETGDITSARLYFERAADAGDARAALLLGQTYDPAYLHRVGAFGVRGDPGAAARWYRKAAMLGDAAADSRPNILGK